MSDLHLVDTTERTVCNANRLLAELDRIISGAVYHGIRNVEIVLLGDIFDILRSKRWLDAGVRPWEPPTAVHKATVQNIVNAIITVNDELFSGLERLAKKYPFLTIQFTPGNHDHAINEEIGTNVRDKVRRVFGIAACQDQEFDGLIVNLAHDVIAKHGHEWDSANRYGVGGTVPIGDAVVIDIVVKFPQTVADKLGLSPGDQRLAFLHEIDTVVPQSPRAMAQWMLAGLDNIAPSDRDSFTRAVEFALQDVLDDLRQLRQSVHFESLDTMSWWEQFLATAVARIITSVGVLSSAIHLPSGGGWDDRYANFAAQDLQIALATGNPLTTVIYGHTHRPEAVPIRVNRASAGNVYLNTGTWRRVHTLATDLGTQPFFSSSEVACCVCLYSNQEQKELHLPRYEFHRSIYGFTH